MSRHPLASRYERLLALCKRNIKRFDDMDREIIQSASDEYYTELCARGRGK